MCLRGHEVGNSLMVAGRHNMVAKLSLLLWRRRADGHYTDTSSTTKIQRTAVSRVLVAAVTLHEPWCGMSRVVVRNCQFHYLTAKRYSGSSESHNVFWDELASTIVEHEVRVLGGDFNMSVWVVARNLRAKGLQVTFAAGFAWMLESSGEAMSDSCGIFIIGPVLSTKPLWSPEVFTSAEAAADRLHKFVNGQGYVLKSNMPGGFENTMAAMRETFAPRWRGPSQRTGSFCQRLCKNQQQKRG